MSGRGSQISSASRKTTLSALLKLLMEEETSGWQHGRKVVHVWSCGRVRCGTQVIQGPGNSVCLALWHLLKWRILHSDEQGCCDTWSSQSYTELSWTQGNREQENRKHTQLVRLT